MMRLLLLLLFATSLTAQEVVLITGASQGVGLATAELLADRGYIVYGTYRKTSHLEGLEKAITRGRGRLQKILMDVTDDYSVKDGIGYVLEKEGKIDVVINNAAYLLWGTWESTTIDEAKEVFDVNYLGPMRLIQAVLPSMRSQKKGQIINISSTAAFAPVPHASVYSASKAALMSSSETLAYNLRPWNISVSLIEPGPLQTNMDLSAGVASYFLPGESPYQPYLDAKGITFRINFPTAQPADEVAATILHVIETPTPTLRYQTSATAKKHASRRSRDPAGLKQ